MNNLHKQRFLVIGLGSMGKRRIRNLLKNGVKKENIYGYNPTLPRCRETEKKYGVKTSTHFTSAFKECNPTAFIISAPPDKHAKYFLFALRRGIHFFVEHPTTQTGYQEAKNDRSSTVKAPSCSWRFHDAMKLMKKTIQEGDIGKVLAFQYHMGQYLPHWHPWEDYRKVYFSKKSTGACREMFAFELGWLCYVMNIQPKSVFGLTEKLSDLPINADDLYSAVVSFSKNVKGNIVIEVLSKKPFRTLRVVGSEGVLQWEWLDNEIRVHTKKAAWKKIAIKPGRKEKNYNAAEEMYEEEIKAFLSAVCGSKKYPFSFSENKKYIDALFALEKSAKTKRMMNI